MSVPNELIYFVLLPSEEKAAAIRRLYEGGMSISTIVTATRLSSEQVQRILAADRPKQ